jgi:hypothetical protein
VKLDSVIYFWLFAIKTFEKHRKKAPIEGANIEKPKQINAKQAKEILIPTQRLRRGDLGIDMDRHYSIIFHYRRVDYADQSHRTNQRI